MTSASPLFVSLRQESRKQVKLQKKEPLVESQLFIMELSRELNKICQVRLLLGLDGKTPSERCRSDGFCRSYRRCSSALALSLRGQTSSPTSGPVKTSGRPACVETLSWNGLPSYR